MIHNIEIIKPLLRFSSDDDFYHLQILKRKKEHPELGSNSYVVKTYYVSSLDYLEKKFPEIVALCNFHNARACINLNVRSFERTAFQTLKKITDQIMNRDFKSVRKSYESVCGEFGAGRDKRWIIDVDYGVHTTVAYVNEMKNYIESQLPEGGEILTKIPTKNGFHFITSPFRLDTFKEAYPDIDVHKNNPTILYIP